MEYMYAYAKIDGSASAIIRNVADWTKNSTTVLSEDQAKLDMYKLIHHTIQGRRYRWNQVTHAPEIIEATDNQPIEELTVAMPAAIQTPMCMFIHLDLIAEQDIVEEVGGAALWGRCAPPNPLAFAVFYSSLSLIYLR